MMEKKQLSYLFLTYNYALYKAANIAVKVLSLYLILYSSLFSAQSIFGDSAIIHISGDAVIYDSGKVYAGKTLTKPQESASAHEKIAEQKTVAKAEPKVMEKPKKATKTFPPKRVEVILQSTESGNNLLAGSAWIERCCIAQTHNYKDFLKVVEITLQNPNFNHFHIDNPGQYSSIIYRKYNFSIAVRPPPSVLG